MQSSLNRFTSLEKKPRHLLQGKKSNRFIRCLRSHPDMLRGFTLVELMVVLAVIAIIASVGGAAFNHQLPKYRLRGDTRSITSTLMLARMKATSSGLQYAIQFNLGNSPQDYRLQRGGGGWTNESYYRQLSAGVNISVNGSAGNARIVFNPNGSYSSADSLPSVAPGDIRLWLGGITTDGRQILLTPATGRIQTIKVQDDGWEE